MLLTKFPFRTFSQIVNSRSPTIRFRYGASREAQPKNVGAPSPASTASATSAKSQVNPASGEPIYDFQIPQRWRRRPISEEEIAYINRGGPE